MTTVRLHIAYDGTAYCGWQIQPRDRTVEGELTRAVTQILGAEEPVKVQGASRTDSGVHASGQVAHFYHCGDRSLWDFCRGLNGLTDDDICVVWAEEAPHDFHARHSARGKIYRYRVWNHRFVHPFLRDRSWHAPFEIDPARMAEGAAYLVGTHDFGGFRSVNCSSETTERTMRRVEVHAGEGPMLEVVVEGDAFLQHMVRVMVGTLVDVGAGRMAPEQVAQALETGDRAVAGVTAPAKGLTLERVFYPDFPSRCGATKIGGPHMPAD